MNYDALSDLSDRVVREYGQAFTFSRKASVTDPLTNITTVTTTAGTFVALALNFSTWDIANRKELIGKESKKLIASSASFSIAPSVNDTVTYNGKTFTIARMKELNPAGTSLLYELAITR